MIEFRKITDDDLDECIKLKLHPEQEKYLASNLKSLAQAYVNLTDEESDDIITPYAIYAQEKMVGFIMLCYYPDDITFGKGAYHLWRLMIDKEHQGKGYGRLTVEKAIEEMKAKTHGQGEYIYVSYKPENEVSRKLFKSFGFVETDLKFPDADGEIISRLKI